MGDIVPQLVRAATATMNSRLIIDRFREWRDRKIPIALVTVFETVGSTYSKAGHRILIAGSGDYQGLVSGGCLEGDLAERAASVLEDDRAEIVTYDLRDEADELFGLGVGCDGLLRMIVQPMKASEQYEPFAWIADAMLGSADSATATVVASVAPDVQPGATLLRAGNTNRSCGIPDRLVDELAAGCDAASAAGEACVADAGEGVEVLFAPLGHVPRLLVLGAGIDAVPLVSMAVALGWRVHIVDHRPAYLEREGFGPVESATVAGPDALAGALTIDDFDAVIVMSHHLATDESYLRQLVNCRCRYVGVLGPPARRAKLLTAIGESGSEFAARLRGPVGLDIGADSPETIALSILAEIQLVLATGRDTP